MSVKTSITSPRVVYLNTAAAVARSGIARPKLTAELEPAAWLKSADGKKLFPLFLPADVDAYVDAVAEARAKAHSRRTPLTSRVSIPADAAVA